MIGILSGGACRVVVACPCSRWSLCGVAPCWLRLWLVVSQTCSEIFLLGVALHEAISRRFSLVDT